MEPLIHRIHSKILLNTNKDVILLREKEVIMWLFGETSFLTSSNKHNRKIAEDEWGKQMLSLRRPDLQINKQWTNKFGEHICEEMLMLHSKTIKKPKKKEHYQPDIEAEDGIYEAKIGTFFTDGTAHEKILGTPLKYAKVPELYSKPLKIVCMAGAEKVCKEKYGLFSKDTLCLQKQKILDCFRDLQIEYVAGTDILKNYLDS